MAKKPENMSLDEINADIAKIEEELSTLYEKKKKIDAIIIRHVDRKAKLKDAEAAIFLKEGKVDWSYLLECDNATKKYEILNNRLYKMGLRQSGYWCDTNQYAVQVYMTKGDEAQLLKVHDALAEVIPFIKPRTDGGAAGYRTVDIFEHTLSRYNLYHFFISEDMKTFKVIEWRCSRPDPIFQSKSLMEALAFIQKNLWYESKDPNDRDEEDE